METPKQGCQMAHFKTKNPNFGSIWEGLAMQDVVTYIYGHLVYIAANRNILRPFGVFNGYLVFIFPFWYFVPRKSGNLAPLFHREPCDG
jgi:hypothetical protein